VVIAERDDALAEPGIGGGQDADGLAATPAKASDGQSYDDVDVVPTTPGDNWRRDARGTSRRVVAGPIVENGTDSGVELRGRSG
jgi:hypothetical protein